MNDSARPEEGNLASIRDALAARLEDCLDRLDDVVEELLEVHEFPTESILERVRRLMRVGRSA